MKKFKTLRSPDPAEGTATPEPAVPAAEPVPATPPPGQGEPPAARVVIDATVTEETLRLRQEKADLEQKLKAREIEVATAKDAHERYRQTVEAEKPIPVKQGKIEDPQPKRRSLFPRR